LLTTKDLEPICVTPALRPEFVDLSLNATTSEASQAIQQEENGENESDED
jgi:hypothetical protein